VLVDLAPSTQAALMLLGQRRYGMILSDMGRFENGAEVSDAGLRLLSAVRTIDPDIPFVIYCSAQARDLYRDAAVSGGATAITASPTTVLERLRAVGILQ
jgi:Response regulator containing CheY-like receiver, AAA-type ATPase, and DNA-binding domains